MPTPRFVLLLVIVASVVFRDPGLPRANPQDAGPARASWVNRLKVTLGRVCGPQTLRPHAVAFGMVRVGRFAPSIEAPTQRDCLSPLESRLPPPLAC